jgi:transcriptional regulator with XRE-family HTH domain
VAGLTQREAAQRLDWSESKLIRVENGEVSLSVTDLRAMLQLYKVTDERVIAELSGAARSSRGSSWWSGFRDVVSAKYALYLGQEASASVVRVFHPFLIPGLLHTEDYAYELLRVHCAEGYARRIVEMRMRRQQSLLGHPDSPEMIFVIGEEALHRWIGGPAVMGRQLRHLLDVWQQDEISVIVIPFNAGSHPGLLGSFTLLGFEDPAEKLVFLEGPSGQLVSRGDQERIDRFTSHFDAMCQQALPADQAKTLIEQLIERFLRAEVSSSDGVTRPSAGCLNAANGTASRSAEAREGRWGNPPSDGVMRPPSRPPLAPTRSSASSPGPLATETAQSGSSGLSAAYFSSLSSASL